MKKTRANNVVHTLAATNIAKSNREDLDFYQTPSGAVNALVDANLMRTVLPVWEPMAGNGAIAEVLKNRGFEVYCSDIVERKYKLDSTEDFFKIEKLPEQIDGNSFQIVTNPPYNMADEFLLHCLKTLRPTFLAVFLPVRYLEGIKRYNEIYSKYTPSDVVVFARRYGCFKESDVEAGHVTDHGIGSAVAYMWLCFEKNRGGSYGGETHMHFVY